MHLKRLSLLKPSRSVSIQARSMGADGCCCCLASKWESCSGGDRGNVIHSSAGDVMAHQPSRTATATALVLSDAMAATQAQFQSPRINSTFYAPSKARVRMILSTSATRARACLSLGAIRTLARKSYTRSCVSSRSPHGQERETIA